jgi:hypothetical protein
MKRMSSPFDPARRAYLEPIEQPIYSSSILTAATPQQKLPFFPVPAASQGNRVLSNISENRLANPKLFVIRGWRLHVTQSVAIQAATSNQLSGLLTILENYYYRFFVGTKDYLILPMFAVPSGLGAWAAMAGAGAAVANEFAELAANGSPTYHNYRKLARNEITIPPQQEFEADLNLTNVGLASFLGSDRRVWNILEGTLGREVQ